MEGIATFAFGDPGSLSQSATYAQEADVMDWYGSPCWVNSWSGLLSKSKI
jgi:hypothetical protein